MFIIVITSVRWERFFYVQTITKDEEKMFWKYFHSLTDSEKCWDRMISFGGQLLICSFLRARFVLIEQTNRLKFFLVPVSGIVYLTHFVESWATCWNSADSVEFIHSRLIVYDDKIDDREANGHMWTSPKLSVNCLQLLTLCSDVRQHTLESHIFSF